MSSRETEKDTDIAEVIPSTMSCSTLPGGKVASLQKHFESQKRWATLNRGNINVTIGSMNDESPSCLTVNSSPKGTSESRGTVEKQISPSDSSGYDSLKSENDTNTFDLDVRLAQALEENDKMFKTFDPVNKSQQELKNVSDDIGPESASLSVLSRIKNFNSNITNTNNQRLANLPRQQSFPVTGTGQDGGAPSPPPRVPVISMSGPKSPIASDSNRSDDQLCNSLSKSASHGDIAGNNESPSTSNGSVSSEDLRHGRMLNGSPSKQSVRSSNDSLTSSSSLVTVKSASLKSLDEEPPELPPRNAASRPSAMKPPLPRSGSQVSY